MKIAYCILLLLAASARGGPPALPQPGVPRATAPAAAAAAPPRAAAYPQISLAPLVTADAVSVELAWNASPSAPVYYTVQCWSDGLTNEIEADTNLQCAVTNLSGGTLYGFDVYATDGTDAFSPPSNVIYWAATGTLLTVTWPAGSCPTLYAAPTAAGPWTAVETLDVPGLAQWTETNPPPQQFFTCR